MTKQQKNMLSLLRCLRANAAEDNRRADYVFYATLCNRFERTYKGGETVRKVKTISISLPSDVLALVDQVAKETGRTRSSFISWALSTNEQVKEARKNGAV